MLSHHFCTGSLPSSLPQPSSPHRDPGAHTCLWLTSCSGQYQTLFSVIPCCLSKQTPSCLPWSRRAVPCTSWHHCLEILLRGSELYTLGFLPLSVIKNLSLSSPEQLPAFAFCFTLDLSCNLISTRTVFFNFFYFFLHI